MTDSSYFFDRAFLPTGWAENVRIAAHNGVIAAIDPGATKAPGDVHEALAIPGVPNLHSHAFQRAMAGLAECRGPRGADDFWSWRAAMYRFLDTMDADDFEAVAAYAYADMLEAGFTSVAEFHYGHRDPHGALYGNPAELALRHIEAASATGIGLTLLPVFYAHSNFGGKPPLDGQRRFITGLDTFARIVKSVETAARERGFASGIAPHSLRAVSPDELAALVSLCPKGPIHIHASEQTKEVDDCLAWSGLRPVEWLLRNAQVDPRWCLVHATHMTAAEAHGLARSGAVAGLCPITEANLGDGVFQAGPYFAAEGAYGIGTDSNIAIDAAGELRQFEYSQRLAHRARNVLASDVCRSTGRWLYANALQGGARAMGQAVGAIQEGHRADFLILDHTQPDIEGRDGDLILDTWIFAHGRSLIRKTISGGVVVAENGRHRAREKIDARYRKVAARLASA